MKISNISNHPSANWTDAQRLSVVKFASENFWGVKDAEIIDIPHPPIPPFATEDEVAQMALAAASAAAKNSRLVFLAGELSFCAAFLHAAEKFRLHVITSTTERIVEEKDGKKISVFKFAGIRRIYKPADLPQKKYTISEYECSGLNSLGGCHNLVRHYYDISNYRTIAIAIEAIAMGIKYQKKMEVFDEDGEMQICIYPSSECTADANCSGGCNDPSAREEDD